ncbi:MAG: rhodanese-like domain-containing protein [Gemmatimonadaceae bacterium]
MPNRTGTDLINEARQRITEVNARDAKAMRERGDDVLFLDVREQNEWNLGRIPGAVHIPRGTLEGKVEAAIPRDRKVVAYCAGGNRSALAADTMREMGYTSVSSLAGGWKEWVGAGGEVEG